MCGRVHEIEEVAIIGSDRYVAYIRATYRCGHFAKMLIETDKDYIRTVASCECPPCVRVRRDAENKAAVHANARDGLPPLVGTQKQIPWAETIRRKTFALLTAWGRANGRAAATLRKRTDAGWWITNGKDSEFTLIRTAITEWRAAVPANPGMQRLAQIESILKNAQVPKEPISLRPRYWPAATLLERGWSEQLIRRYADRLGVLQEPMRSKSALRLFHVDRVREAEKDREIIIEIVLSRLSGSSRR